jgi:AcrR family transcriptional regulator
VTRERLLRSAREVFSAHGYERTTPAAVAAGAGVSRTAFYRYFDSKLALYRALVDDTNRRVIEELFGGEASAVADPAARIARLFRLSAQFNSDDRSYGRFLTTLIVEGFRDPELADLAQGEVDRFKAFFTKTVADAVDAGASIGDPGGLVDLLLSLQWGLGLFAAFIGDQARLEATVEVLVEQIAPGLLTTG